ncbi:MAG TPA: glucoamylase family protein [Vicinamibacterales bacterium]|nr:glucoamylase family protein [Vicinamibacterales bacterium]
MSTHEKRHPDGRPDTLVGPGSRIELLGIEPLEEHARRLGALFTVTRRPRQSGRSHLQRLESSRRTLRANYRALAAAARSGESPVPAAEWLLDNFHMVEASARDIVRDLPRSFFRRLPTIAADEFEGYPRIYGLALELIRASAGHLDAARLSRFITAFQSVTPLTIGELWAWPSMLKLALVEHVCVRAEVLEGARAQRQAADEIAGAIERSADAVAWPDSVHPALVTRLLQRFREYGDRASALQHQLIALLKERGQTIEDAILAEGQHQASEQASMANLIGSLRLVSSFDWGEFFESVSLVEQILRRDPAGVYAQMDFRSRDRYRHAIEELAEPTGDGQLRVALKCVERARRASDAATGSREAHIGYYLIGGGRRQFERSVDWHPAPFQRFRRLFFRFATPGYLGTIALGTLLLVAAAAIYAVVHGWRGPWLLALVVLLTIVPASELTIQVVQRLISRLIPPRRLPRLDLERVPADARTMVIVPTMLDSVERVAELLAHLEVQALGNVDPNVHFALLTDFRDAVTETLPLDATILEAAASGIRALNARHRSEGADRFFLFHRQRQWNAGEGLWMGWERKRGKIEEFNRLLRGATDTSFVVTEGNLTVLPEVRYCITLDSDTRLPRDTARQLIGIIAHPLNRPGFDARAGRVTEGYGILQPRISVTFASAAGSWFARLYAGHTGVDPYTTAVSDTYQDLFGEGIFTGKGLYDVDAFNAAMSDLVPENALLSHDLFEGLHARAALVSDIELVDEYPTSVLTHARRQHRWIRGDWQILFWLFPFVPSRRGLKANTLPVISRWKILDNLRRSLVSPSLLMLLVAGWVFLPGSRAVWTGGAVLVLASQLLPFLAALITGPRRSQSIPVFFRNLARDAAMSAAQAALSLAFLAFHAFGAVHAIGLTLARVVMTRRRLLEWETAAAAAASLSGGSGARGLRRFVVEMVASPVVAGAVGLLLLTVRPAALPTALPFLVMWLFAPGVAFELSRPVGARVRRLADGERAFLRTTARKTWRYFETFVTAEDSWLPPDNYQEWGGARIAHRTSPTNIGLSLLSTLAAHDLGYVTTDDLLQRVERTLTTLERLERFRGHFLNWYDTTTLAPLHPRYVSTVDSGNLAASLMTLAQGLEELPARAQTLEQRVNGLHDTAVLLVQASADARGSARADALASINRVARALVRETAEPVSQQMVARVRELATDLPPLDAGPGEHTPEQESLTFWLRATVDAAAALTRADAPAKAACETLAARAAALANGMQFGFLYDRRKRLFSVGFHLADGNGTAQPDGSFYDLLASEARLASFVAISKGDVPQHHWFNLGRPVTNVNGRATLVSWGGTMFEYLMPLLVMRSFPGTLIDQSCRATLERQRQYGREREVPWGISESAYALTDRAGNYQYRAFGVPGLGLRRGLSNDLVIAPYATALAALVDPASAADNLKALASVGLDGRYGFYESRDYQPRMREADAAPEDDPTPVVVRAFFAHHQGMSLIAIANVVCGDLFVDRFHRDPRIEASELLLQERVPREAILPEPRPAESADTRTAVLVSAVRRFRSPHTNNPHTHFLSNGRYTVALTHAGGGYSSWRGLAVTRQREDRTSDSGANYIFLRDPWSGTVWSPTYLPVGQEPDAYEATFELDKVTYRSRSGDFDTQLQVTISSEDDVEIRRLSITNRGSRPREIEVTSYAEIVLARPTDDLAHPAFGKLFVETEFDAPSSGLLFSRRPRGSDEARVWAFHVLGVEGRLGGAVEWETDRARLLGRGRSPARAASLDGRALSGTTGAVLDPVASLRDRVRLAPGAMVRVTFATGVADDRTRAQALARKYRDGAAASRAFSMAFTHVHVTLQHLGLSDDQAILFDRVASRLFGDDATCASPADLLRNTLGQSSLWAYSISGDLPIALVRVSDVSELPLVRQLLLAQEYWRVKGLAADVVILNEHAADYLDETQQHLVALAHEPRWADWNNRSGGIYLLRVEGMPEADRTLLAAVARVVLRGDRGDLDTQLTRPAPWLGPEVDEAGDTALPGPAAAAQPVAVPPLTLTNRLGGFTAGGGEYVVVLEGDQETPLPWSNVMANAGFGTMVTTSGSAFTWAGNSRENRLTPFANDPVTDPTGEAFFLRDDDSGAVWGATPGPLSRRPDGRRWIVRHAAGVTSYQHATAGLQQDLRISVAPNDPVKFIALTVTNTSNERRRLSVFAYVEWVLGPPRAGERRFVTTEVDAGTNALLAHNVYNSDFRDSVAFLHATERWRSFTCDRTEFIGRNRTLAWPHGLGRTALSGRCGAGLDPCAAMQIELVVEPQQSRSVAFILGQGSTRDHACALARTYSSWPALEHARHDDQAMWDQVLGAIQVHTPDDSFDVLVNRWLPYQTLSCRIWARSGPYQPGGAFGFRDQLQDVLALLYTRPDLCREQLLRAASRQFVEGDVQHWWHPPGGRGTRTRCSDDLLWLPYAVATYVSSTGDEALLDEVVPFIEGPLLAADQHESYTEPHVSTESASVFEHCIRAIAHAGRYGAHGLPLIGSGDWNDGMNRVGHEGRGESVWLGWFLAKVLNDFAGLCERRGRQDLGGRYRSDATWLTGILELSWDGGWYRRAYFDDGTPLGSAQSDECRIDSLTQSWAVLSGVAQPARARQSMEAVRAHLLRREAQLVLLLTPPFDRTEHDPGYIKGYLPGVRENGGQYTHAALWAVLALAALRQGDEAMELFHLINPINHTRTDEGVDRYRGEPYAVAADVYAHPMHVGRAGWTWYTGSAGWMYRAAIEGLLGLRRRGATFTVDPSIPAMWPGFSLDWSVEGTTYHIEVTNPDHRCAGVASATLDDRNVDPEAIPLVQDGGLHTVQVVLGRGRAGGGPAGAKTGSTRLEHGVDHPV